MTRESQDPSKAPKEVTALDMTPKEAVRVLATDPDQVQPIKRGFYGEFFNCLGLGLTRLFLHYEARGLEHIPDQLPYILAPNHETYVDGMWVGGPLPREHFRCYTCLGGQDLLTDHGYFGRLIMRVGRAIPINRRGRGLHGTKMAIRQVKQGNILMIHPEGTRTRDGRLGKINDGAAFISRHSGAPLIPVFIDGGYEIFSRHMKFPSFWDRKRKRRRRLIITYGPPLYPEDYASTKAMTADLSDWMHRMYEQKEVPRESGKGTS